MKRSDVHCTMYIECEVYIEYKVGTQGGQRTGRREISGVELTGCCHVGATRALRSATVVIHIYSRESVFLLTLDYIVFNPNNESFRKCLCDRWRR